MIPMPRHAFSKRQWALWIHQDNQERLARCQLQAGEREVVLEGVRLKHPVQRPCETVAEACSQALSWRERNWAIPERVVTDQGRVLLDLAALHQIIWDLQDADAQS